MNLSKELKDLSWISEVLKDMNKKNIVPPENFPLSSIVENPSEYRWSAPRLVKIPKSDGKSLRDIYIFNEHDSMLQKIINKILFSKEGHHINKNVFSYQKGKRTFDAAKHIQDRIKSKLLFGVKIDISNYFLSVSRDTIERTIEELVDDSDGRVLLKNLFNVNRFYFKEELVEMFLSIMPGAAISSFFANYILKDVDEFLQSSTEVYARYSDDLIFFCETQELLDSNVGKLKDLLSLIGLSINDRKVEYLKSDNTLEYLGLSISEDLIDVSSTTMNNIKRVIKNTCKKYRKELELSKNKNVSSNVKKAIQSINRKLYKGILNKDSEHKSSRMSYVFSNITTDRSLKVLDYYICDCLNYVVTGKFNKSSKRWTVSDFEELGFFSSVRLMNLYKLDKDIYINQVSLMNKTKVITSNFQPVSLVNEKDLDFIPARFTGSFSKLYYEVLETGVFIFNGMEVPAEYITFDLVNDRIYFQDLIIAEDDVVVIKQIKCRLENKYYVFNMEGSLSSLSSKLSIPVLIKLYLGSSYTTDLSIVHNKPLGGFTKFNLFKVNNLNELLATYTDEYLNLYKSYEYRQSLFLSYLYFNLKSNSMGDCLNLKHNLIKIEGGEFNLVLDQSIIRVF